MPDLFIDFGSTYTKLTAVDVDDARLLGTASCHTTVQTDVGEGFDQALQDLTSRVGRIRFEHRFACSSAAGGLRMIASGLVPDLTVEAARQSALGAGAKVIRVFAYQLTDSDLDEIECLKPDIFLLTGGTDGGNSENILTNARRLSTLATDFPIVIAGNRNAADECRRILRGRTVQVCENVMPRLNEVNSRDVQQAIRSLFLKRIVEAKGLGQVREQLDGILMPTPAALLEALKLLAAGCPGETGIGPLMGIDLGGATTDVYSIADGQPTRPNTILKGLQEPFAKRTVEGDIGMRYSVHGILQAAGIERICGMSGLDEAQVRALADDLSRYPACLPDTAEQVAFDAALAALAIETAAIRHAGTVEPVYTPMGLTYVQKGKDLREVRQAILTGGPLVTAAPGTIPALARHILSNPARPESLRPQRLTVFTDQSYILAAMGLLSQSHPKAALKIMKEELRNDGAIQSETGS